ncbi:MAG TPA: hypothetical protein VD907_02245 [Verrucomicrobiae bacterium]|nr:hypothetical protein [Verrucomicrobiae bacterium]
MKLKDIVERARQLFDEKEFVVDGRHKMANNCFQASNDAVTEMVKSVDAAAKLCIEIDRTGVFDPRAYQNSYDSSEYETMLECLSDPVIGAVWQELKSQPGIAAKEKRRERLYP